MLAVGIDLHIIIIIQKIEQHFETANKLDAQIRVNKLKHDCVYNFMSSAYIEQHKNFQSYVVGDHQKLKLKSRSGTRPKFG